MPPASNVSNCLEPVVIDISSLRRECISVAVVNPMGTSREAIRISWVRGPSLCQHLPSVRILVAFCSEIPLICSSTLFGLRYVRHSGIHAAVKSYERICHRFNSVESTINDQLDVSSCKSIDTLQHVSILCKPHQLLGLIPPKRQEE